MMIVRVGKRAMAKRVFFERLLSLVLERKEILHINESRG